MVSEAQTVSVSVFPVGILTQMEKDPLLVSEYINAAAANPTNDTAAHPGKKGFATPSHGYPTDEDRKFPDNAEMAVQPETNRNLCTSAIAYPSFEMETGIPVMALSPAESKPKSSIAIVNKTTSLVCGLIPGSLQSLRVWSSQMHPRVYVEDWKEGRKEASVSQDRESLGICPSVTSPHHRRHRSPSTRLTVGSADEDEMRSGQCSVFSVAKWCLTGGVHRNAHPKESKHDAMWDMGGQNAIRIS